MDGWMGGWMDGSGGCLEGFRKGSVREFIWILTWRGSGGVWKGSDGGFWNWWVPGPWSRSLVPGPLRA
eukprot:8532994-Karenia_brevis.AAC.1